MVFGEDATDRAAVAELVVALCPPLEGRVKLMAPPITIARDTTAARTRGRARRIAAVVEAERVQCDVLCVFVHRDADAAEPAHEALIHKIEAELRACGCHAHVVAPAWELEAWWFLWPDAVAEAFPSWRRLTGHRGREIGRISHAKKALRDVIAPTSGKRTYRETDAPKIGAAVRRRGEARAPQAVSRSYEAFRVKVEDCCHDAGR